MSSFFGVALGKNKLKGDFVGPSLFHLQHLSLLDLCHSACISGKCNPHRPSGFHSCSDNRKILRIGFQSEFSTNFYTCCFSCTTDMTSLSSVPAFSSPWFQAPEIPCFAPALLANNHRSQIHTLVSVINPAMRWAQHVGSRKCWRRLSANWDVTSV